MSIKKKIQQSMTVILTVTLVLAYVILSVILYNRNMNLLQTEVKQEAAYIREAINLSDSDYMKQMDNVVVLLCSSSQRRNGAARIQVD